MSRLDHAVAQVRDGTSLYWAFYDPQDADGDRSEVEVRLNGTKESVSNFIAPEGWQIHRVEEGDTLYLRREQPLDRAAVEDMLIRMLDLAAANRMQLHSWLHGADIG